MMMSFLFRMFNMLMFLFFLGMFSMFMLLFFHVMLNRLVLLFSERCEQFCRIIRFKITFFVSNSTIHPSLLHFQVNQFFGRDCEWVTVQDHEVSFFSNLNRSNNVIKVTLPCCINCDCFNCLIRCYTLFLIQNLIFVSDNTSDSIVNTSDWINRLASMIRMQCWSQSKFNS